MDIAKHRFKPESISFLNRASGERGNVEDITDGLKTENLRDPKIQEELISEYLKDHQVPDATMERVYELNRAYNKIIEEKEEVSRNVNWKLSKFEFDNLFNYGSNNSVNFSNLNGIIGIFGKNFSGKSSIIDAALYTMFNTTSKNERKNLNVINQNKEECLGKLTIDCNNKTYTIGRTSKKYVRRLKGEETLEAKTDLNFEVYDPVTDEVTSLNGTTRNETDANIRKHFGTIDDFMVSSLASQHGALAFIDEGSTRRKEIIAKFLDLEVFEKKFRMAKEDSVEAKVLIKKHENRSYDDELEQVATLLSDNIALSEAKKNECQTLKDKLATHEVARRNLEEIIAATPTEVIDIASLREEQKTKSRLLVSLNETIAHETSLLKLKQVKLDTLSRLIDTVNLESLLNDKNKIAKISNSLTKLNREIKEANKKQKLLDGVPCGDAFQTCKFICDAHKAVAGKSSKQSDKENLENDLQSLNPKFVESSITKYESVSSELVVLDKEISGFKLSREKNKNTIVKTKLELKEIADEIKTYEDNKEAIEGLQSILNDKRLIEQSISRDDTLLEQCENESLEIVKMIGSYEQKIENLREQKKEYNELQNSYAAYDLYMQAMHPNGIAYDIIKKKIPVINQEIAKVLANIVDFEIFFESSGNKFDIFIKHPQYDERPIEMASGAEKTMAAMAIRLALLSVSSLPKGDLFILDEPGTALDEENMEGFIRILELIKVYFKNVLLISHLDSLKDCVDMQIVIDKKHGYARVNQ